MLEPPFLIMIGVFIVIACVIAIVIYVEKKRTKEFENLAMQMGFNFDAKPTFDESIKEFTFCKKGRAHKMHNLLVKRNMKIFDYTYIVGGGKNQNTHRHTIIRIKLENEIPAFVIQPEHFFHKLGVVFGMRDINFDNDPDFSKRYVVKGDETVREFFDANKRQFLLQHDVKSLESNGKEIIIFQSRKRLKPSELTPAITQAQALARTLEN